MQSAYPAHIFEDEDGAVRPTVQAIVCRGEEVAMVKPVAAANLKWWIPPQKGVDSSDVCPSATLERGLYEELGIVLPQASLDTAEIIGSYLNPIPRNRMDDGTRMKKRIIVVAVRVPDDVRIKLDLNENADFQWVPSWEELDFAMAEVAEVRIRKYVAMCRSILIACKRGLLSWKIPNTGQMSLFVAQ
jgi:8-oxo-dGTP pyrophosphatase MutT (NUDIX family)